jgi:hypothetical protein
MLSTSWKEYVSKPVKGKYEQLQDSAYCLELLGRAVDKMHLALVIAMPIGFYYAFSETLAPIPEPVSLEQKVGFK